MITNFCIQHKVIREATWNNLPRVMFICGPNGVGKTTLLDALGRVNEGVTRLPTTKVAVAPATRTWRKEQLQSRMLHNDISSIDAFALTANMGSYGNQFGRQIYTSYRDLWNDDDSKQLVKPLLAKLKMTWKEHLASTIAASNYRTEAKQWPDPKSALMKFTGEMFDELQYIDTHEQGEWTTILFNAVNRPHEPPLDIDDLSSGEKAIFSVFLPVIEEEFRRDMGEPGRELTLIVDEAENHLHPSIQLRMLDYMRRKSQEGFQFICTTHSTVLIKACAPAELFHLLPGGITIGNQFRQASTETYSLEEVTQDSVLFANGFQRHIFCEGYHIAKFDETNICDSELYADLISSGVGDKIIASTSCDAVIAGARAASATVFAPICIAAVRDHDSRRTPDREAVWCDLVLPVYSMESLLINTDAIAYVLQRYQVKHSQISEAIAESVKKICDEESRSLVTPGSVLERKAEVSQDDAMAYIDAKELASVFQVRPSQVAKIKAEIERLAAICENPAEALKALKGKKMYRYVFETLRLKERGFTQRAFAKQVILRIKEANSCDWIRDMERVAKRGVGNALTEVLCGPTGNSVRAHPVHKLSLEKVCEDVEKISLNGFEYAVIKDGVRIEHFAKNLAPLATALNELMPDYRWIAH